MALFAASVDSKSTRPQPLDLPPGCLATSDWTTVPTWEQWAVRELGVGIGSWVSKIHEENSIPSFGGKIQTLQGGGVRRGLGRGFDPSGAGWGYRMNTHR